jgi:hypothetical protein
MRFRRCDVIYARHWAMGVHVSDSGTISDIHFEDIAVNTYPPVITKSNPYLGLTQMPKLLRLRITTDIWGKDTARGQIRDVTLRNITLYGPIWPVELQGYDAEHTVSGVTLTGIHQAGQPKPLTAQDLKLSQNAFVSDIQVLPGTPPAAP